MIGLTSNNGYLVTTGSAWSADAMDRNAVGFAAEEAALAAGIADRTIGFDALARAAGYNRQISKMRTALAGVQSRSAAMQVLLPLVFEIENRNALADAFLREVSVSLDMREAAE